jgi:hypothetical protein
MSVVHPARISALERARTPALGVGIVCLIVCVIGAFFDPDQFFRAYLAAYIYVLGIAHGCFMLVMIYHLTGGAWGLLIRRIAEAGTRTLPLLAVLFTPIACGLTNLYPWARPAVPGMRELAHKEIYLNAPFFWVRAAVYFIAWCGIAFLLNVWSRRQDETGDRRYSERMGLLSAIGLVIFGITITFASVDWLMSLQPAFHSSIFGPLLASGELLQALSFTLIILAFVVKYPPLAEVCSGDALNDLGSLLFSFLIIWAYMVFFQFMLIWIADLPTDVLWFLPRSEGGWYYVVWLIFIFNFAIPFFLLLMRDVKRDARALARVGGLVLGSHILYSYYTVIPIFHADSLLEHWMDFLTPLGIGGVWLAYFLWQLGRRPLLPRHDPEQEHAVELHQLDLEEEARERELYHA